MRLFLQYLRGKAGKIVAFFLFAVIFIVSFALYHLPLAAVWYPSALCAALGLVILLLDFRGTRLLLPGDTNLTGYDGIAPGDLRADLFKVGHHGQKDGADTALAEAIRPAAVVCCASSDRRYSSACPDTLKLLADCGAKLYFSDCPPGPGMSVPPHQALAFTVGSAGALEARYVPVV